MMWFNDGDKNTSFFMVVKKKK